MLERAARPADAVPAVFGKLFLGSWRFDGRARRAEALADLGWWGAANGCSLARLSARRPAHSPYQRN